MKTQINGKEANWTPEIEELWNKAMTPLLQPEEQVTMSNYYTPRPYRNEYDQGSNKEGFTYILQPGNKVCFWEKIVR